MEEERLTYRQSMTGAEAWNFIKAVAMPVLVMILSLYTIATFASFGTKLIAKFIAIMWLIAVFEAFFMGSQRKSILNEALIFIGVYNLTLLVFRGALSLVSNVTTEELMASYDRAITVTNASTIPGYLQYAIWMTAVLVPIGYLVMQGKRIFQFKKKISKSKEFERLRSIRK